MISAAQLLKCSLKGFPVLIIRENHILLMHIDPSPQVHANQSDEVYLRIGDKSKLLRFEERLQLMYDKGERYF